MKRFLIALALVCACVAGNMSGPSEKDAKAQMVGNTPGYCMGTGVWTSTEAIFRNNNTYRPKTDLNGDATVCLGGDGMFYVLVTKNGVATDLHFLQMSSIQIDY